MNRISISIKSQNPEESNRILKEQHKKQNRLDVKLKRHFNEHLILYIPIILIATSTPLCFFEKTYDLGLNLTAEMTGVAVTVYIIDRIYKRRDKKNRFVIDKRIFADLKTIIASYFAIWKHLIWKYCPDANIQSVYDLINKQQFILENVKLDSSIKYVCWQEPEPFGLISPRKTILENFQSYEKILNDEIIKFISEYKLFIDPELYDILKQILESEYNRDLLSLKNIEETKAILNKTLDNKKSEEELNTLITYLNQYNIQHFKDAQRLIEYSNRLFIELTHLGAMNEETYKIKNYFNKERFKTTANI